MSIIISRFPSWLVKPLKFGVYTALMCLIFATFLGEPLLFFFNKPIRNNIAVVLILDTSDSMNEVTSGDAIPTGEVVSVDGKQYNVVTGNNLTTKLDEVKQALSNYLSTQTGNNDNEYSLVTFGSKVNKIVIAVNNPDEVKSRLVSINASGSTAMDEALEQSWKILQKSKLDKKAILMFTDGLPDNIFTPLEVSKKIRKNGGIIVTIGTSESDRNYLEEITGNKDLFFHASAGNFEQAFTQAGNAIRRYQLLESQSNNNDIISLFRVCLWTIILATAISLSVIIGQNLHLKRRIISRREIVVAIYSGVLSGTVAGASGQLSFVFLSTVSEQFIQSMPLILMSLSRITGWTLLGSILGAITSAFIPNLKKDKAIIGGTIGGILAGGSYLVLSLSFNDSLARLVASSILGFLLGMMIAVIEQITGKLYLLLRWPNKEQSRINLGKNEVLIGSSEESHIYVSRRQGYPPKTAKIFVEDGKVYIEFSSEIKIANPTMHNLRQEFKIGSKRKIGDVIIELIAN